MGELLGFIGKLLGMTAKTAAAFTVAGVILIELHRYSVGPFKNLDMTIYLGLIALTILSFSVLVVAVLCVISPIIYSLSEIYFIKRRNRRVGLKNMHALWPEYAHLLAYLKQAKRQRFHASTRINLFHDMWQANLIEIDDPNWTTNSAKTFYIVPNHIWSCLEKFIDTTRPLPPPAQLVMSDFEG